MRKLAGSMMLLTVLAGCAGPAADIVPLPTAALSQPLLSFDGSLPEGAEKLTGWMVEGSTWPGAFRAGMAKIRGMNDDAVAAIAAVEKVEGGGGMVRAATSIADWRGKRVRLSGRLKSEDVASLRMWLGVRGPLPSQMRRYDMKERPITGTTGWQAYQIVMDVPADAVLLNFGFHLDSSQGAAYGDAFTLEEVGPEVAVTPLAGVQSDGWQLRDVAAAQENIRKIAERRAAYDERMRREAQARQQQARQQPNSSGFHGADYGYHNGTNMVGHTTAQSREAVSAYDNHINRQMNGNRRDP